MHTERYWAKTNPWQSVITHGLVSGHIAQVLFENYLSEGTRNLIGRELHLDAVSLRDNLGYFSSLHDIGKIAYSFQSKDPQSREILKQAPENSHEIFHAHVRHERTGEDCVRTIWRNLGELTPMAKIAAQAIGAHHPGKTGKSEFNNTSVWFFRQQDYELRMRQHFLKNGSSLPPNIKITEPGVAGAVILAILILSDWIASGPAFECAEDWIDEQDTLPSRVADKANDFLDRSGLRPHKMIWPDTFSNLWTHIPDTGKRPLQVETESLFDHASQRYQLVLLEAPMGEGKTEAGMFAALKMAMQWKKDGFYLAMPTAATANQMVDRMRALFQEHAPDSHVRLLHSMAWLEESEMLCNGSYERNDELSDWLAPVRRGLLGQYAVGTVDQAMLAATTVKFGALRLLGLSNKVLIIDEVHSYDAYMSEILQRLLEWCKALEIPVVMLSATLPPDKKHELFSSFTETPMSPNYPLITAIADDGTVYEQKVSETFHHLTVNVSLFPILNTPEKIADTAIDCVEKGGSLCILMNTVREAQSVYTILKERWDGDLLLFHAQFPAEQRKKIEEECIKRYGKDKSHRPGRSILVATQVVEQSLDVDFDCMFSAVAPIDLLLQRLGRVHRHEFSERPENLKTPLFCVLTPDEDESFGSTLFVYPECLLRSSIRILGKCDTIRIPDDIAEMVRSGYDPNEVPPEELNTWCEKLEEDKIAAGSSTKFLANPPQKQFRAFSDDCAYDDNDGKFAVKTRLAEPSVRIALLDNDDFEHLERHLGKNDKKHSSEASEARVCSRNIAEMVMKRSLTISLRLFKSGIADICDYAGTMLLAGVKIIHTVNKCKKLHDGRILSNDPELGLIIKDCEK